MLNSSSGVQHESPGVQSHQWAGSGHVRAGHLHGAFQCHRVPAAVLLWRADAVDRLRDPEGEIAVCNKHCMRYTPYVIIGCRCGSEVRKQTLGPLHAGLARVFLPADDTL